MWVNDWGEEFSTEEDARENVWEHMRQEDYECELGYIISQERLLKWAMEQDAFHEAFQDEISKAENEFFNDAYHLIGDE